MAMSRRYNHTMSPSFAPLQLLLMMFAGWINRHQLDVIDYLQEENRLLKERLERAVRHYMAHYHSERNHQGLENRLPQPASITALLHYPVQRRQRLGGMLSYYHRAAA